MSTDEKNAGPVKAADADVATLAKATAKQGAAFKAHSIARMAGLMAKAKQESAEQATIKAVSVAAGALAKVEELARARCGAPDDYQYDAEQCAFVRPPPDWTAPVVKMSTDDMRPVGEPEKDGAPAAKE